MSTVSTEDGGIYNADCYHNLQPFCLLLQSILLPSKDREAHHHCSSSKPVKKGTKSLVLVMAFKQLIFSTAALN